MISRGLSGGGSPATSVPRALEWKFSQVFGERVPGEEVQEVDIISAIEFDKTGEHLATGDRGGRVVLFQKTDAKDLRSRKELERADSTTVKHPEFHYKTEFQSHEPEFDYLKSLEIEEKINKVRWSNTANGALFILSTNNKTIKSWKVLERKVKKVNETNLDLATRLSNGNLAGGNLVTSPNGHASWGINEDSALRRSGSIKDDNYFLNRTNPLRLPTVLCTNEVTYVARCRKVYGHAHDYHINSISINSDGETYISADDLRINLWNFEVSNQSFNIVDIKPTNMEDLAEVITSAEFHPVQCNTLAYSSSKGTIRLVDMRQSALCDRHTKIFEEVQAPGTSSFFTEIIASISDIKFPKGGRYILSRDYMSLKLWDMNMESAPISTFKVHEYLRPKLCDLYENDSIFDKFDCCTSGDGLRVATGSYSNLFRVFGVTPGSDEATTLEANKHPTKRFSQTVAKTSRSLPSFGRRGKKANESSATDTQVGDQDFKSKLLHMAWHPQSNLIACAALNSLYMYHA
ncbi:hypothetical protein GOP47_0025324 [Adiantum capillus-veneris]|uniref:Serine/threonine-protein phosphatase 2A 55 kDa regulatory subunit B n=1 Tax=Adiantum capillus-veneris TaxID=13818 RepID=A0A9D4Z2V9_ADICA|nr:hypothetical protein GOP47_0025324 [Adiantum capillus-veneris]